MALPRSRFAVAMIPLLLACGGSPAAPTAPSPPVNAALNPGVYSLTVTDRANVPDPGNPGPVVCLSVGTPPGSVRVSVTLEREGPGYRARAVSGTLLFEFAVSGSAMTGTVAGTANDETGEYSLAVNGNAVAALSGVVASNGSGASGYLTSERFTLYGPQGFGGCSPVNWVLLPR